MLRFPGLLIVFLGILLLLSAPGLYATITVLPTKGGSLGGPNLYYYVNPGGTNPALDSQNFITFTPLDTYKTLATDSSLTNMFEVSVYSDKPFTLAGTQQAVVTFQVTPSSGASSRPAPIAAVNGVRCDANNGNCTARDQISPGYYFAAKYPFAQATVKIGFYPSDICVALNGQINGCTVTSLNQPTEGKATTMPLTFSVSTAPDPQPTSTPSGSPLDSLANVMNLVMQVDVPTFTCADATTLGNSGYTPGDTQIYLNTNFFFPVSAVGAAPRLFLAVAGSLDAVNYPVLDSTWETANPIHAKVPYGSNNQAITGFLNSTGTDNKYTVSFMGQDAAGVYALPPSQTDCSIYPVQTADIQGFLGKSSCFIATAAFGSGAAAPVVMLRDFRDRILMHSEVGQEFVSWYYRWSPGAAQWILQNPVFRLPLLLLLFPLEALVWLCLNPVGLLTLLGLSATAGVYLSSRMSGKDEEARNES